MTLYYFRLFAALCLFGTACAGNKGSKGTFESQGGPVQPEAKIENQSFQVAEISNLPGCTPQREGSLAYVRSTKKFYSCESGEWKAIEIEIAQKNSSQESCKISSLGVMSEISCGASKVSIQDGLSADGAACSVSKSGSVATITCGTNSVTINDGINGAAGATGPIGATGTSCSVSKSGMVASVTCGTQTVQVVDGAPGASCSVSKTGSVTTVNCGGQIATISDGVQGASGFISLTNISNEVAGANCPAGGRKISSGVDNGDGAGIAGNSILENGEVDSINYVCNGEDASRFSLLAADNSIIGSFLGFINPYFSDGRTSFFVHNSQDDYFVPLSVAGAVDTPEFLRYWGNNNCTGQEYIDISNSIGLLGYGVKTSTGLSKITGSVPVTTAASVTGTGNVCRALGSGYNVAVATGIYANDSARFSIDSTGSIHAAYQTNSGSTMAYATCSTGCSSAANWNRTNIDSTIAPYIGNISITRFNNQILVFYRGSDYRLELASCQSNCSNSANWTTAQMLTDLNSGYKTTTKVYGNTLYLVTYRTESNGTYDMILASCTTNCGTPGNWSVSVMDGLELEDPDLHIDSAGGFHLAGAVRNPSVSAKYYYCQGTCSNKLNWSNVTLANSFISQSIVMFDGYIYSSIKKRCKISDGCLDSANWKDFGFPSSGYASSLTAGGGYIYASQSGDFFACSRDCAISGNWSKLSPRTGSHGYGQIVYDNQFGNLYMSTNDGTTDSNSNFHISQCPGGCTNVSSWTSSPLFNSLLPAIGIPGATTSYSGPVKFE